MPKHKKIKTPIGGIVKIKNYLHGKTNAEIEEMQTNALINLGKIKKLKTIVSDLINVENGSDDIFNIPEGAL